MKKGNASCTIILFLTALLCLSPVSGASATAEETPSVIEASLSIYPGLREDNLDWNIAGNIQGANPNILSELTWSDLSIIQIRADGRLVAADKFYLRASFGYGEITDGENQDSDYAGDNRTFEFSRSNNSADSGDVMDASAGLGYQFNLRGNAYSIALLAGYSYHEQNLVITDGNQTIPPTGSFSGLNSTYKAIWKGPWAGIDVILRPVERLELSGMLEYHRADFEGTADWNLRTDFQHPKSFEQIADGSGILITASIRYAFSNNWSLSLISSYQDWSADAGTDRTFFADGTEGWTRLNEVNWDSISVGTGIVYSF